MHIRVNDTHRLVEAWMASCEQQDPTIQAQLESLCVACHKSNYTVAVFRSGSQPLYPCMRELLLLNRVADSAALTR